ASAAGARGAAPLLPAPAAGPSWPCSGPLACTRAMPRTHSSERPLQLEEGGGAGGHGRGASGRRDEGETRAREKDGSRDDRETAGHTEAKGDKRRTTAQSRGTRLQSCFPWYASQTM